MKYNAKPGMDESAGAVARGNKNSQPPGKPDAVKRPKAKPSMMAPKSSKRPMADPKKKQATYPGRKQPNVKL